MRALRCVLSSLAHCGFETRCVCSCQLCKDLPSVRTPSPCPRLPLSAAPQSPPASAPCAARPSAGRAPCAVCSAPADPSRPARCRSAAAIPGAHGARSWWRRASRSVPRRASLLGRGCEWTDGGASRGWHRGGGWCRGAWAGSHRRGSGASASSVCVTCTFDPRCSASS